MIHFFVSPLNKGILKVNKKIIFQLSLERCISISPRSLWRWILIHIVISRIWDVRSLLWVNIFIIRSPMELIYIIFISLLLGYSSSQIIIAKTICIVGIIVLLEVTPKSILLLINIAVDFIIHVELLNLDCLTKSNQKPKQLDYYTPLLCFNPKSPWFSSSLISCWVAKPSRWTQLSWSTLEVLELRKLSQWLRWQLQYWIRTQSCSSRWLNTRCTVRYSQ